MRSEFSSGVVPQKMRVFTRGGVAILLATTSIGLMYGATARAEDAAMLKKREAQIQRLEERHQSEIKALRAEIRQLRRQKPPTSVAATQAPPTDRPRPPVPAFHQALSPALPARVLMTYDRGYHFGFSDATGDNTVELLGRLQLDTGGYTNYNTAPRTFGRDRSAPGAHRRHRYFHDRLALCLCL